MTTYTIERADMAQLVALVLGMRPTDEAVIRLSATIGEGWLGRGSMAEVARETTGVGDRRLERLEASIELGRRALHAREARKGRIISGPEDVVALMRPLLVGLDQERFFAIATNVKQMLLRVIPISAGSGNASIVAPSILFREAIQIGAASLIAVHAHPSGDSTPSGADISLTRRLVKAGGVVGVEVIDHIVLGHGEFSSLRELNLM